MTTLILHFAQQTPIDTGSALLLYWLCITLLHIQHVN